MVHRNASISNETISREQTIAKLRKLARICKWATICITTALALGLLDDMPRAYHRDKRAQAFLKH